MQDLSKHLKEQTIPFVIYHENGHAILDSLLYGQDPKIIKIGFPHRIPNTEDLSIFLNGNKIKFHTPLDQFFYKNYQEAFCDCTAMYSLYKETKDINVIDNIIMYRQQELIKHNINYPNQLSGYMNISALKEFKNNIVSIIQHEYKDIYMDLNKIVLNGLKETIYVLADNNDLFLKSFQNFIDNTDKIKNKTVVGFFNYFDGY